MPPLAAHSGALAVLDSGGYQLELLLLPRKPTAEDLARAGHSPSGTYAYLMLYVSSLETATSKHELPLIKLNPEAPKDVVSWDVTLSAKVLAGP